MPNVRTAKAGGGTKTSPIVTGTENADSLRGTNGGDIIDGRGGADTMRGGRGNDVYYVDNSGDTVIELAGEGVDEVRSTISYALPGNVENLTVLGTASHGYGNSLDNRLTGNDADNTLLGMAGSDFMVGGGGADLLDGGSGSDHLDGGAGDDTYVVDNATDFVLERFDGGTDTVHSSINYQLSPEIENLTLIDGAYVGMGNYRDNRLVGNSLDNRLDGKEGNDWIDGGAGNDALIGGAGSDSFIFSTALRPESFDGTQAADGIVDIGNVDTILDFDATFDGIVLDDAIFAGLVPGALPEEAFRIGPAAADADDRIIYDPSTGALMFDADGISGVDAIHFATIQTNVAMTASDFTII